MYRECAAQLVQLEEEYLILILDDFLIRPRGSNASRKPRRGGHDLESGIPASPPTWPITPGASHRLATHRIETGHRANTFYSDLQIAIWQKEHLQAMLEKPLSIWEFEHHHIPGSVHCAITEHPPITYHHVVERGRWLPEASSLLREAGLSNELGDRPVWPKWMYAQLFLDQVRWHMLGYSTF